MIETKILDVAIQRVKCGGIVMMAEALAAKWGILTVQKLGYSHFEL